MDDLARRRLADEIEREERQLAQEESLEAAVRVLGVERVDRLFFSPLTAEQKALVRRIKLHKRRRRIAHLKELEATASSDAAKPRGEIDWLSLTPEQQAVITYLAALPYGDVRTKEAILDGADGLHDKGGHRPVPDSLVGEPMALVERLGEKKGFRLLKLPANLPPGIELHPSWQAVRNGSG